MQNVCKLHKNYATSTQQLCNNYATITAKYANIAQNTKKICNTEKLRQDIAQKIRTNKAQINHARIARQLHGDYAQITNILRTYHAEITQQLLCNYAP